MDRDEVLVKALQVAGKELMKFDPTNVAVSVKENAGDIVTSADLSCEKIISDTIKASFPKDIVISEETPEGHYRLNETELAELTAWVIDPIDGTNNFKRSMAYSGISIAHIEAGKPVIGGILDPYRNFLYIAKAGHGATCNGKSIQVSRTEAINSGTRICTSNSASTGGTLANLERYAKLGDVWVDVLGSSVLIMADIASGRLDLYHHTGLKPWDNAAAFLLIQEAGGKIVNLLGQPVTWLTNEAVAGNPKLVDKFIAKVNA